MSTSQVPDRLAAALAGRYRVERELGQGGMATVYLAHDFKHDRNVAIKVLHPDLGAALGAERFLSEIRTTARLQHPHILPLLDSGEADGLLYYVMPLVTGETLRSRLERDRQLPVADALRIAREVADALGYAHGQNVIHRDIKPENILLQGGHALVADFGIALAVQQAGGQRMTQTGLSLGTPQYMSPEQAMGERAIDPRSDIYALGAVVYEMLVGEPPFTGPTVQAIVARLITEEPRSIASQRKAVPPEVDDAVMTALAKLPADRFATAAEMSAALSGEGVSRTIARRTGFASAPAGPWRRISIGLGVLVVAMAALSGWLLRRPAESAGPTVFDAALPDSAAVSFAATTATTSYGLSLRNLSVAPSGDFAVYAASLGDSTGLWYRSLRDATVRPIPGTIGATAPRISPDGARVAYLIGGRVMMVPIAGGEPRRIREGQAPMFLHWDSPATLVFGDLDGSRLNWLDPEAGQPRTASISRCGFAGWIPDDRQLICSLNGGASVVDPETNRRWQVRIARPDGSPGPPVVGTAFRVVDRRYLVYLSADGALHGAPYDPALHLVRRSVPLVTGVRREAVGEAQYDVTERGDLVYAPGADAAIGRIVRIRPGAPPEPLAIDAGAFQRFDLSRDRRWLAAVMQTADGQELQIHDLRDGQHLTWLRAEYIRHPLWSADGERLLVGVRDSTRWTILAGSPASRAPPDTVYSAPVGAANFDPVDYRADTLAIAQGVSSFEAARFDPTSPTPQFDTLVADVRFASASPDLRHLVYGEASGRVVVTDLRPGGRLWQVATDGTEPLWLSASEILYRSGVSWFLARIDPRTGEPLGSPTFWARDPRFSDTSGWSNRPSHDGGIVYVQGPTQVRSSYLRVVPRWAAQMKTAVDAANR